MNLKERLEKELKKAKDDLKGVFGLEITTTDACNFRCKYCFEKFHKPKETILDGGTIVIKVKELLNSDWFKEQYSGIKIILWGGEPTMNLPLCDYLFEEFMDNPKVCFFLYTNGSRIIPLLPTLRRLKKEKFIKEEISKITVQISYDGNPIHDKNRLDKKGNPTSDIILNSINLLHKEGINYGLKGTMSWDDYKHIPECWDDYNSLHDKFGSKIKYALTVDYYDVRFSTYKEEVEDSLIKVAQREVKFFRKHGYFLSNIFRSNRAICATGKNMCVVDTKGNIYNCHGAIYSKCSEDFKYGDFFNENFINNIKESHIRYQDNHFEPEECKNCVAVSCLRCNVKKYEESKKEDHLDRWYDYTSQEDLCDYYKLVGKINYAMRSIIGEE